jgi:hypothetical protein
VPLSTVTIDFNTILLGVIGFVWTTVWSLLAWMGRRMLGRIEADVGHSAAAVTAVAATVSSHTTELAVLRAELSHLRSEAANAQLRYQDLVGYVQRFSAQRGAAGFEPRRSIEPPGGKP